MSAPDRSIAALEAALLARVRDREQAERGLSSALSVEAAAHQEVTAALASRQAAKAEAAEVWTAVVNVGRLQALRAGASDALETATERVRAAKSAAESASGAVLAARRALQSAQTREEAIRRLLDKKRLEARRLHDLRAEEDSA